jgi:hypothetical protein
VRQPGDHANDGSLVPAIADVHQLAGKCKHSEVT